MARFEFIPFQLCMFDKEGEATQLVGVVIFVNAGDPIKEPPLITTNNVMSILSMDYPVDKVSCYVFYDEATMLDFENLLETSEFAWKWMPFCKSTVSIQGLLNSILPKILIF